MRYLLGKEEWKHLYPLKKLLLSGIEAFLLYSLLGFLLMLLLSPERVKEMENAWWIALLFAIIARFWTPYTIKCIRTHYLCVPMASRYLSKKELKKHLEAETFQEVEGSGGRLEESEYWYRLDGHFIAKNLALSVKTSSAYAHGACNYYADYTFLNGEVKSVYIGCYLAKTVKMAGALIIDTLEGTRLLKDVGIKDPVMEKKDMERFFKAYLSELGKERMKLIKDPEGLIRCGTYLKEQRMERYRNKGRNK